MTSASSTWKFFRLQLGALVLAAMSTASFLPAEAKNPISLNLTNAGSREHDVLRPYMIGLRRKLQSNWKPQGEFADAECQVRIVIGGDGKLLSHAILKSTGDNAFDESVLSCVLKIEPLPHVPVPHVLIILATFDHNSFINSRLITNRQVFQAPQSDSYPGRSAQNVPYYQSTVHRNATNTFAPQPNSLNQSYYATPPITSMPPVDGWHEEFHQSSENANQNHRIALQQKPIESKSQLASIIPAPKAISVADLVKSFRLIPRDRWISLPIEEQRAYADKEARWLSLSLAVRFGPIP